MTNTKTRSRTQVWWIAAAFIGGLVLAGAGTATAAKMINGASIKNNTIAAKKLTKKVRTQLKKVGPAGPAGPQGPQGPAGPSTGAAGGSLSGSYPNPGIADRVVGPNQLATVPVTRVVPSTPTSIGNGSAAPLPCSSVELTTDQSMYTGTPGTLIAPRDGIYLATASAQFESDPTGTRTLTIFEGPSGVANRLTQSRVPAAAGDAFVTASAPLERRAGQPVTFWVAHSSGGALDVRPDYSFCSLQWVSNLP